MEEYSKKNGVEIRENALKRIGTRSQLCEVQKRMGYTERIKS